MEGQEHVVKVLDGNSANRLATNHGVCYFTRTKFETSQVLWNPG